MAKPLIAVITENSLANIGLKDMLEKLIPYADTCSFFSVEELQEEATDRFFHYFVSFRQHQLHPDFFLSKSHITIVFGKEEERPLLPPDFHFLATDQTIHETMRSLMILQQSSHAGFKRYPQEIAEKLQKEEFKQTSGLTPREIEILKLVARGLGSKEIARQMHISLFTVTTHRKNIMEKFHAHSTTKAVVYAVNHGLINPNEI